MRGTTELRTARLRLRIPKLDDAPALFANYASDPHVTEYLTWDPHASVLVTSQWLLLTLDDIYAGKKDCWVIDGEKEAIGMIELRPIEGALGEVGYALSRAYWGQGLMPEALREVLAFAGQERGMTVVRAYCDVENLASARVMQKAGMRFIRRVDRHACHGSSELRDAFLYAYPEAADNSRKD